MKKSEMIELVNELIDGTISEAEKKVLDEELKTNSEAEKYYNEMLSLGKVIEAGKPAEQEIDFSGEVMRKIEKKKYAEKKTGVSIMEMFSFMTNKKARYAVVFGLGLVGGILINMAVLNTSNQTSLTTGSEYSGTMSDISKPANFNKGGLLTIDKNGIKGEVNSYYLNDMIFTEIKIKSNESYSMKIGYNNNLKVYALRTLNLKEDGNIGSGNGVIQISGKGDNTFIIMFKNKNQNKTDAEINIFSGSNNAVYSSKFTLN